MAILTSEKLATECRRMAGADGAVEKTVGNITYYKQRYGYVLGGQGHDYSKKLAEQWGKVKRCGKSAYYFVTQCKAWFGRKVVDCSGMIVEAYRAYDKGFGDKSANYFYNSYTTERGKISTLPEQEGVIVWKSGHIGVYLGGGLVVEARGYKYGVVISKLSTQKWTNWGRLKEVEYIDSQDNRPEFTRLLKYKSGMMRGEDVKELQTLLTKAGQAPGVIDGIFGRKTRDAVRSFQRAKKLKVDGIAGKNTVSALGGIWKG